MYVAAKGGERAIESAHDWLADERRGDRAVAELSIAQIREQLALAVDRVMAEGSVYDPDLAALAIKQARGDLIEAIFLVRAYRTTLPRFGYTTPVETAAMRCDRRISATYKDLPGGQVLGPTFDYTHRLIDFALAAEGPTDPEGNTAGSAAEGARDAPPEGLPETPPMTPSGGVPHVTGFLNAEGLIEGAEDTRAEPPDLTREPFELPAERALRLQTLARADEGFTLGMAYSTQRGFGRTHAFVGELRIGAVPVEIEIPELGFAIEIGEVTLTECETVNQFIGSKTEPPQFTRGYGLVFGRSERKAISMSLVDRALRWEELGEDTSHAPAQDAEFVLSHGDNIQATGFLEHIKLPHYVDFQSELELIRKLRREAEAAAGVDGAVPTALDPERAGPAEGAPAAGDPAGASPAGTAQTDTPRASAGPPTATAGDAPGMAAGLGPVDPTMGPSASVDADDAEAGNGAATETRGGPPPRVAE